MLEIHPQLPQFELATDEAILDYLEENGQGEEVLRIWESPEHAVVLGISSRIAEEVNTDACIGLSLPILRRMSGGSAVVIGPGCFMYSLFLSLEKRPDLGLPERAHQWVLSRIAECLQRGELPVSVRGISDLASADRKFSGNSLRRKRRYLLYHGTILYAFPLELISWVLKTPPRQPAWRRGRTHGSFLANLPVSRDEIRHRLMECWHARRRWDCTLWTQYVGRAAEKYCSHEWTWRW